MNGGRDFLLVLNGGFKLLDKVDDASRFNNRKIVEHLRGNVRGWQEAKLFVGGF